MLGKILAGLTIGKMFQKQVGTNGSKKKYSCKEKWTRILFNLLNFSIFVSATSITKKLIRFLLFFYVAARRKYCCHFVKACHLIADKRSQPVQSNRIVDMYSCFT